MLNLDSFKKNLSPLSILLLWACGESEIQRVSRTPTSDKTMQDTQSGAMFLSSNQKSPDPAQTESCLFLAGLIKKADSISVNYLIPVDSRPFLKELITGQHTELRKALALEGTADGPISIEKLGAEITGLKGALNSVGRDCVEEGKKLKRQLENRANVKKKLEVSKSDPSLKLYSPSSSYYSYDQVYNYGNSYDYNAFGPAWGNVTNDSNAISNSFYNYYYQPLNQYEVAGAFGKIYNGASTINSFQNGCGNSQGFSCVGGGIRQAATDFGVSAGFNSLGTVVGKPIGIGWEIFSQGQIGSLLDKAVKSIPGMYNSCHGQFKPDYCIEAGF